MNHAKHGVKPLGAKHDYVMFNSVKPNAADYYVDMIVNQPRASKVMQKITRWYWDTLKQVPKFRSSQVPGTSSSEFQVPGTSSSKITK